MAVITCEKCNKVFVLSDEPNEVPLIGGQSLAVKRGLIMNIDRSCPYCGHNQEEETFLIPL